MKGKCKTKDLKTNFRFLVIHLPFIMLLLVIIFTNCTANFLNNKTLPYEVHFVESQKQLCCFLNFLWFPVIWNSEINIYFTVLMSLRSDHSFLTYIKSVHINCILTDWLMWKFIIVSFEFNTILWGIVSSWQLSITQYTQVMFKNIRHV